MQGIFSLLKEVLNVPRLVTRLYSSRELIVILTWRDFRARFRGSFGGLVWAIIQPLVMMLIYTLVFSVFLKVKFGSNESPFNFAVFLLCGMLPWSAFAESIQGATSIIRGNSNLVKRVVFPLEILPVNLVLVATIQQLIGFFLLIPLIWIANGKLYPTLLYFPLILLIQLLLYTGLSWIWSSLAVYLPDLRQLTAVALSGLMFLTPIFYPESTIPQNFSGYLLLNPFAILISLYRSTMITGSQPDFVKMAGLGFFSLIVFLIGYGWFNRTKKGFADIL